MVSPRDFVVDVYNLDHDDAHHVGSLAAKLGELHKIHIPIKKGFVITPQAFFLFIKANKLDYKINHLIGAANFDDPHSVYQISHYLKRLIVQAEIPSEILQDIHEAYKKLGGLLSHAAVDINYSTTDRFQKYTTQYGIRKELLDITGEAHVLEKVRRAWASFFSPHVVFDSQDTLLSHLKKNFALVVQQSVNPQLSGFMYITSSAHEKELTIHAQYGLLQPGSQHMDEVILHTETADVIAQQLRVQHTKRILKHGEMYEVPVSQYLAKQQKLSFRDMHELLKLAQLIKKQSYFGHEIRWVKEDGKIYVTDVKHHVFNGQSSQLQKLEEKTHFPVGALYQLATGKGHSRSIGIGRVFIAKNVHDLKKITKGDVVVISKSLIHHYKELKKAAGIIIEGKVHDADFKYFIQLTQIPTVSEVGNASKILQHGHVVTVHAKKGIITRGSMMVHTIF